MNIINIIKNNLSSKKLKSYKLLSFVSHFFAIFLKNLPPTTYNLQPSSGFTLIETLVAVSILMIAVASPLTIAQKGLSSAIYAKDQVIASYLAQDAIEYLRNLSDQNVASGKNWLNGVNGGRDIKTPCGTACTVDTTINSGVAACSGACLALKFNTNNNTYNNSTGNYSPFTRSVKVTESVTGVEALITVTISWSDKGKPRNLVVNTRIFNWR